MKCKYCGQRLMDTAKRCPICKKEFTEEDIREMLEKFRESDSSGKGFSFGSHSEDDYQEDPFDAWKRRTREMWRGRDLDDWQKEQEKARGKEQEEARRRNDSDSRQDNDGDAWQRDDSSSRQDSDNDAWQSSGMDAWQRNREDSWRKMQGGSWQNARDSYAYRGSREQGELDSWTPQQVKGYQLARTGFICSIAGAITSMIMPALSIGICVAGVVACVRGLNSPNRKKAIAGLVICILAFFLALCCKIASSAQAGIMSRELQGNLDMNEFLTEIQRLIYERLTSGQ